MANHRQKSRTTSKERAAFDRATTGLVAKSAIDLFRRKQHGHMGDIAYLNGGASLFEKFVRGNPDYYPYSGEIAHITANRESLSRDFEDMERAIVIGPGPASSFGRKEMQILSQMPKLREVHFIDLSEKFNRQATSVMQSYCKKSGRDIAVHSHVMDFRDAGAVIPNEAKTAVFSTGSLISNLSNAASKTFPEESLRNFLDGFSRLAGPDGKVLIGYDSNDDQDSLLRSYNRDLEPFMVNIMTIIRDHAEGARGMNTAAGSFTYKPVFLHDTKQITHQLTARKCQKFAIQDDEGKRHRITLRAGDTFTLMSSLKPPTRRVTTLGEQVGMDTSNIYIDRKGLALHVFDVLAKDDGAQTPAKRGRISVPSPSNKP